jgi:hypothetical protein
MCGCHGKTRHVELCQLRSVAGWLSLLQVRVGWSAFASQSFHAHASCASGGCCCCSSVQPDMSAACDARKPMHS